jgi:hypothetical protein
MKQKLIAFAQNALCLAVFGLIGALLAWRG